MLKRYFPLPFLLIAVSIAFIASGCSLGEAGVGKTAAASSVTNESDPEIRTALQFIEKVPDSVMGYDQLAVLYIQRARRTGDFALYSKAETAVKKALEISPQSPSTRKLNASLMLTFHRFDEALAYGKQLQTEAPNDAFVYGVLTDANVELGNYDDAVAAAQKMVDLKPNSSSYARVAHLRSIFGDHKGAVEAFTTAARTTDPMDKEAQSWCLVQLGDEYFKNGNFSQAESIYDESLGLLPDYHLALAAKGKIRAAQGDLTAAETFLTRVLNTVPNAETAILLGDIYAKNGEVAKARTQYELAQVMETQTGVNNDQKRLALMWLDQDRQLPEALEIARRENSLKKDIYTEDVLAWALFKNGKLDEANESTKRAMRTKANDARILFHAGMIQKGLGNRSEAAKLLRSAIKLNPGFDLIQIDVARTALAEIDGAKS